MATPNNGADWLLKAARAGAEAFLSVLNEAEGVMSTQGSTAGPADQALEYDPLHDEPPFTPSPKPGASDAQGLLATVTYLGAIGRLNAEEGRGAVSKEVSQFAKKAGYSGGAAVNGWNSRRNSPRLVEIVDGGRFLNADGLAWITENAQQLHIKLSGEIATVPRAESTPETVV